MTIGIDARLYKTGLGIGRYIEKLIGNLEQIDQVNTYVIFLRKEAYTTYHPTNPYFKKVLADIPWYSFREQCQMPSLLAKNKLDLVHFPHFNVPIFTKVPFVVTIHDLIMVKFPQSATSAASTRHPFIHWLKYCAYRWILSRACSRAHAIITVSNYVRDDLVRLLGIDPQKISVIYEAAGTVSQEGDNTLPSTVQAPYILSIGNAYPHKNLETLLKAFALLRKEKPELQLVLCGQEDYFYHRILAQIHDMGMDGKVIHLGIVSDATLSVLYRNAEAYVFPSYEEGFGLPGLEAMAAGIPVVASNLSCLPEIYGDAALYFNPSSQEEIKETILRVLTDTSLRHEHIKRGLEHVKKYSWEGTARRTKEVYSHI